MTLRAKFSVFWQFLKGEFWLSLKLGFSLAISLVILTASTLPPLEPVDRVRVFTRGYEFDYVGWTIDALLVKLGQSALGVPRLLTEDEQRTIVLDYINLVKEIDRVEYEIEKIYANPELEDKNDALVPWQSELSRLRERNSRLGPIAEQVMQEQIGIILDEFGINLGGQTLPPTLYHVSPLPYALIISPRKIIRQDNNISLDPDLTLEEMVALEDQVEQKDPELSALVVPIGGIGTYPTMVMSTSNINWLAEVVAHEWIHNYLTLRPLGWNYETTPQLRTMNETTASLAGKEIGEALIRRFYPEFAPAPTKEEEKGEKEPQKVTSTPQPPRFDFNKEMRVTRVTADQLLAEGKIEEAEAYMLARRQVFWDNGYLIRKLNQAYFAFHGAYADVPGGGSAGSDPVGPTVVRLREQSASLADFLNRISWMTSYEALEQEVASAE